MASEAACLNSVGTGHEGQILTRMAGMGAARAEVAARELIKAGAATLVSFGFAGALSPALKSGDLCLVREVRNALGEHFPVTPLAPAGEGAGNAPSGILVSAPETVLSVDAKQALQRISGADCVDLESFTIAKAAHEAGVPCMVVRVIIDDAGTSLPEALTRCVDDFGRPRAVALVRAFASRPGLLLAAMRLAWAEQAARRGLRAAAAELARRAGEEGVLTRRR